MCDERVLLCESLLLLTLVVKCTVVLLRVSMLAAEGEVTLAVEA